MDENVRDVLIALITVSGGLLTALGVAKLTAARARALERERWKRELFATFLHAADGVRDGVRTHFDALGAAEDFSAAGQTAQQALFELKMLKPKALPEAEALWRAATTLSSSLVGLGGPNSAAAVSAYAQRDEAYRLAMLAFVAAAEKELA